MKKLIEHPLVPTVGLLAAVVGVVWTMHKLDSDAKEVFSDLEALRGGQVEIQSYLSTAEERDRALGITVSELGISMDRRMDKLEHEHMWLSDVRTEAAGTGNELLIKALEDLITQARQTEQNQH